MNETEALRTLMEADRWIEKVNAQRSHLPESAELAQVESELRTLAAELRDAQQIKSPVRASYDESAGEAARLRSRADDLATTLATSTANARELTAIQVELDHVRELLNTVEDRELSLLMELEPLDDSIEGIKQQAQPLAERRSVLQIQIGELQATLDDEVTALRVTRSGLAGAVSPSLLARYEAALARSGGSGAAQVVSGRCDGCRIALSPLDVDRWKSLEPGIFMPCPECARLLLP